jgi:diaminopimelate epimerase
MRIPFTKMQGSGNDFVVIDETQVLYHLSAQQYQAIAERHFGVGADQILSVRNTTLEGLDFEYVIHNADGSEVEHCGNGARCFLRYVRESGLSQKSPLRVKVKKGIIELVEDDEHNVTVQMGSPMFELERIPFLRDHALETRTHEGFATWSLDVGEPYPFAKPQVGVVSMGNPHAVMLVDDVDTSPVLSWGPLLEHHPAFPERVNVGFMQVLSRERIRLRVFERGAGETLACGTGACAAVVCGIRWGLLDANVKVLAPGGELTIQWLGGAGDVSLTGPAVTVFKGELDLHD